MCVTVFARFTYTGTLLILTGDQGKPGKPGHREASAEVLVGPPGRMVSKTPVNSSSTWITLTDLSKNACSPSLLTYYSQTSVLPFSFLSI